MPTELAPNRDSRSVNHIICSNYLTAMMCQSMFQERLMGRGCLEEAEAQSIRQMRFWGSPVILRLLLSMWFITRIWTARFLRLNTPAISQSHINGLFIHHVGYVMWRGALKHGASVSVNEMSLFQSKWAFPQNY